MKRVEAALYKALEVVKEEEGEAGVGFKTLHGIWWRAFNCVRRTEILLAQMVDDGEVLWTVFSPMGPGHVEETVRGPTLLKRFEHYTRSGASQHRLDGTRLARECDDPWDEFRCVMAKPPGPAFTPQARSERFARQLPDLLPI